MEAFNHIDITNTLSKIAAYAAGAQYDLAVANSRGDASKAEIEAIKSRQAVAEVGAEIVKLLAKVQYP